MLTCVVWDRTHAHDVRNETRVNIAGSYWCTGETGYNAHWTLCNGDWLWHVIRI